MTRRRRVRPARPREAEAPCPGCRRMVRLRGYLELIPPHRTPGHLVYGGEPGERGPAGPPCPWAGEPIPGRPNGHVSGPQAERVVARQERDRSGRVA